MAITAASMTRVGRAFIRKEILNAIGKTLWVAAFGSTFGWSMDCTCLSVKERISMEEQVFRARY